jgi:hypothetical protein
MLEGRDCILVQALDRGRNHPATSPLLTACCLAERRLTALEKNDDEQATDREFHLLCLPYSGDGSRS